jgi:hypothetical protein
VAAVSKYDWHNCTCADQRVSRLPACYHYDIRFRCRKLDGKLLSPLDGTCAPARVNDQIAAFDVSELAHAGAEGIQKWRIFGHSVG